MDIKLYADELSAAMNFSTFNDLATDGEESTGMYNSLTEFISNSSSKLSGEQWNAIYTKLNDYSSLLTKRVTLANSLSSAISGALKLLIDYMGEYPMLDYSKLDEIRQTRGQCLSTIDNIKRIMYSKVTKEEFNEETQQIETVTVDMYDSTAIGQLNNRILELESSIIELDKLIAKLEGLEGVYNQAKQMLDEAFAQISAFNEEVGQMVPTAKVVYVPASA